MKYLPGVARLLWRKIQRILTCFYKIFKPVRRLVKARWTFSILWIKCLYLSNGQVVACDITAGNWGGIVCVMVNLFLWTRGMDEHRKFDQQDFVRHGRKSTGKPRRIMWINKWNKIDVMECGWPRMYSIQATMLLTNQHALSRQTQSAFSSRHIRMSSDIRGQFKSCSIRVYQQFGGLMAMAVSVREEILLKG